ncbi:hypothetical protein FBQ97_22120, partial [Acidobacteria bacterium ACD]|nr:hypothetical protein [Acidobacteria bacterium ACD]
MEGAAGPGHAEGAGKAGSRKVGNRAGSRTDGLPLTAPSTLLLGAGLAASVAWYDDAGRWGLVLAGWLAAIVGLLGLAWAADRRAAPAAARRYPWTRAEAVVFLALLAAAAALRAYELAEIPYRLHNDEMSCGIEAARFLSEPRPSLFGTGWFDCPNLGFFLTSLPMLLAGPTI